MDARRPLLAAVTLAVVAGGGVFALTRGDDADPAPDATTTTGALGATTTEPPARPATGEPAWAAAPAEYVVTYRVESFQGEIAVIDTEKRYGRPPFDSAIVTREGEPPATGVEPTRVDRYLLGGFETGPAQQDRALLVAAPGAAARSALLSVDVPSAVAAGVIEVRDEERTVAGRRCRVLRTKAPSDLGQLVAPTATEHTDLCVTSDRLVLQETWTRDGDPVSRRTAVEVDTDPVLPANVFRPTGMRAPRADGGGRVRRVTVDSRPPGEPFHHLPAPPDGFEHQGRYGIASDAPDTAAAGVSTPQVASIADVYIGGTDVLVVENGGTTTGAPLFGDDEGTPVDVGPLGRGRVVFLHNHLDLRIVLPTGRYVRLTGTLPLARLQDLARRLVAETGPGEVTPFDEEVDVTGRLDPGDA